VLREGAAATRRFVSNKGLFTSMSSIELTLFIYKDHVMPNVQIMEKPVIMCVQKQLVHDTYRRGIIL
jgi:hypothetical protein